MGQSLPTSIVSDQAQLLKIQQQRTQQEKNEIHKCLLFSSHFNEISLDLSQTEYQLTNRSQNKLQSFESTLKQQSKILHQDDNKKDFNSTRFNQDNDLNQSFGSRQFRIKSKQHVSEYEEDLTDDLCSDNSSIQNISKDFAQLKKGEQNKKPIDTSYVTNNKFWQQDNSSLIPNIEENRKQTNQSSFNRIIYNSNNSNKIGQKQSPEPKKIMNCEKLFTQPEPTSTQEMKLSIDSSKQTNESMRDKFDRLLKQNGKQGQNKLKYFNHKFFLSPKDTDTEEELVKAITSKQVKKPQNMISPRNIQSPKKTYLDGVGYSKKGQSQQKQNLYKPQTPKQQYNNTKQQQNKKSPQSPLQDQLLKYQQARELLQKPQIKPDDMRAIQTELQRLSTQVKNQLHEKQQNYNQQQHYFDDNFGEQLLVEVQSEIKNLQKTINNHISPSGKQFNDDDQIINKLPDYKEQSIDLERLSSYQESADQ